MEVRRKANKATKVSILLFVFVLVLLSVSAQPPFQTGQDTGAENALILLYPKQDVFQVNGDFDLHFHVLNSSGYPLSNATASCFYHVYDQDNEHVLIGKHKYVIPNSSFPGGDFKIPGISRQETGVYAYNIWCNSTYKRYGFVSGSYEIVNDLSVPQTQVSLRMLSLMITAIFCVIFFVIMARSLSDFYVKFASAGLAMVYLVLAIGMAKGVYLAINLTALTNVYLYATIIVFVGYSMFIAYRTTVKSVSPSGFKEDEEFGKKW